MRLVEGRELSKVSNSSTVHVFFSFSAKQSWRKIECKGDLPSPRAMATLATVGTKLYLFGGLNQDEGWLEGVYMFDTGLVLNFIERKIYICELIFSKTLYQVI